MEHDEFPPLTEAARTVLIVACHGMDVSKPDWDRRFAAAVIREAFKQAQVAHSPGYQGNLVSANELLPIADNLHALPPTREQMEDALQSLIDEYGDRVAGEWTDAHLQTLSAGIAHYCKVQP